MSADGNLVAFSSDATNLGPVDTNGARDVYLFNRTTGTTVRPTPDLGCLHRRRTATSWRPASTTTSTP